MTKLELLRLAHEKGWLFNTKRGSVELGNQGTGQVIELEVDEEAETARGTYTDSIGLESEVISFEDAAHIIQDSPRRLPKPIKRIEL